MSSLSAAPDGARPAPAPMAAALSKLCITKCRKMDLKCQLTAFNAIKALEKYDGGKHKDALLAQGYSASQHHV